MDVTPLIAQGQQIIQSYSGGTFKISGKAYPHPILVYPNRTEIWGYKSAQGFAFADFESLIENARHIDVTLLGCGAEMALLPPELRRALKEKGLSVEIMTTGAACRTYNVLLAEGRRVAAALLPMA